MKTPFLILALILWSWLSHLSFAQQTVSRRDYSLLSDQELLQIYVDSGGENKAALAKLGPEAIRKMTEMLRLAQGPRKLDIFAALEGAMLEIVVPNDINALATAEIYATLKDKESALRLAAVNAIGRLHGARASDAWLYMLNDTDQTIRIQALHKLAWHGPVGVISKIDRFAKQRARALKSNEARIDSTLDAAAMALRVLKARAEGRSSEEAMTEELRVRLQDALKRDRSK